MNTVLFKNRKHLRINRLIALTFIAVELSERACIFRKTKASENDRIY